MTDDKEPNDGFHFEGFGTKLKIDPETAKRILRYIGPHLHWIVRAVGWAIILSCVFYGLSLYR